MEKANEICRQLGPALAMLGAHTLIGDANGLQFQIRGCKEISHIRITLDPSDTYTVQFGKYNRRTFDYAAVDELSDVYADSLH